MSIARKKMDQLAEATQAVFDRADEEDRDLSRRERAAVEENLTRIKGLRARLAAEEQVRELGIGIGAAEVATDPNAQLGGAPGDAFV